ncbi:MAG: FAD-dependent oxidoreductase, partial [Gammaproteobacteria bacterium]|nr:FAD-dependent oxidoreductase [Gammaproteobacteria bacterium]
MVSRRNFLKSSILAAAPLAAHNAATQDIPEKPLPGTLTLADYHKAVAELRKAIGDRWVFTDDETELRTYRDVYSTTPDEAHMPAAAVAPRTVEEIQAILRIARDYRIPLWTISTGKNYAYGGPAPMKPGYFVLDLNRMKRIIEVNEEHGYAVVEPGVSYFDLYNYLQRRGSKLWIDPAAPGWGSVLGNL